MQYVVVRPGTAVPAILCIDLDSLMFLHSSQYRGDYLPTL